MDATKVKNNLKNKVKDNTTLLIENNSLIETIVKSSLQTKNWRKLQSWYINGKKNECEKYQRTIIETIIKIPCKKSNDRIYMKTYEIVSVKNPLKQPDGFEYTEDFDGKISINNNTIYFNLKFVCDSGGAQTRSLREVYHFIKSMIFYLQKHKQSNTYFINILDGNFCNSHSDKYKYLEELFKDDIELIKKYVFIGDLHMFQTWWKTIKL
jgi:hypothetical protein